MGNGRTRAFNALFEEVVARVDGAVLIMDSGRLRAELDLPRMPLDRKVQAAQRALSSVAAKAAGNPDYWVFHSLLREVVDDLHEARVVVQDRRRRRFWRG